MNRLRTVADAYVTQSRCLDNKMDESLSRRAEDWRQIGIAAALVKRVIAECRQRGIGRFSLAATPESERIYHAMGVAPYRSELVLH